MSKTGTKKALQRVKRQRMHDRIKLRNHDQSLSGIGQSLRSLGPALQELQMGVSVAGTLVDAVIEHLGISKEVEALVQAKVEAAKKADEAKKVDASAEVQP
jgi:hypothetical protein